MKPRRRNGGRSGRPGSRAAARRPRSCTWTGFRFDLAATLARELDDVDRLGSFFDIIHQDPVLSELGLRLTGRSDLYHHTGRRPHASINFVTAHDGFTLHDLVSYDRKHNQANGEDNRDGSDHDLSWNCGVEGRETGEPVTDDDLLLLFNGAPDAVEFTLPAPGEGRGWRIELDTSRGDPEAVEDGASHRLEGRSMALLASPLAGA